MPLDNRTKKPTESPELTNVPELTEESQIPTPEETGELEPVVTPENDLNNDDEEFNLIDDKSGQDLEVEEDKVEPENESVEGDKGQKQPIKQEADYETRYKESSKEALILFSKNKKLTDTIEEASNIPEPTEEELAAYARANHANYDELDDFSKSILKETLISKNQLNKIKEVSRDSKALDAWVDKVDVFLDDESVANKYPTIAASKEEFKSYCLKSGRQGVDLDLLAASFLYSTPKSSGKKKGSMFLTQGSNRGSPDKPKQLTAEDLAVIRTTDPKRYKRLVQSGKTHGIKVD